jgi:EmrB/QacA subfamily drug resistance transporter
MATTELSPSRPRGLAGLSYEWQALIVVVVGTFMVILDTTVVNIALPQIITVFNAPVNTAEFVLTGYLIALAIVMPATGYLSDSFGSKRVYLISIFLFTVGSLFCSLSWDVASLVFFRILQGLGGGLLTPLGFTILFKTVPPERRGLVTGVFGLPILFAPVVGPTLGGYIVQYINWRFIFTLNLPVGILGLFLGWMLLCETELVPGLRFDVRGFVLAALGFSAVLYALAKVPDWGWSDARTLVLLAGGGIVLLVWIVVELTETQPLLELRVLRDPTFALSTLVNFIITVALYSSLLLMPLFLQDYRGLGAFQTGLLLFPQAVASAVVMPISGRLFDRFGPRPLIVPGLLLLAYATWRLTTLDVMTPDANLRVILVLRGLAMGLVLMPALTVALNTLPNHMIARGSALTNVLRQLFSAFATAIFITLLQSRQTFHQAIFSQTVTPDLPGVSQTLAGMQDYLMQQGMSLAQAKSAAVLALYQQMTLRAAVSSFEDCFFIAAVICLLGIVPALFLRSTGVKRPTGPAME